MKIPFRWAEFPLPGPFPSASGSMCCSTTWEDLCWAAITVGKRNQADILKHGAYSWFELVYRMHMLWANLQSDSADRFVQTAPYGDLDRSEKGAISFFLGMAVTKLLAADILDVPWLLHMSNFSGGKYLSPDFIGSRIGGGWVVLEAKGRSNGMTSDLKDDALAQAKRPLSLLDGTARVTPSLRIASIAHFSSGCLRAYWEDPEEDANDGEEMEVEVNPARVFHDYYYPIVEFVASRRFRREERALDNRVFTVAKIEEIDVEIGLDAAIMSSLISGEYYKYFGGSNGIDSLLGRARQRVNTQEGSYFPDGMYVKLGSKWNNKSMRLDPRER